MESSTMNNPKSKKFSSSYGISLIDHFRVVLLKAILTWSYLVYNYYLCLSDVNFWVVRVLLMVVYHVITVLFLWALLKTMLTKSYGVPENFKLPDYVFEEFYSHPIDVEKQNKILRDVSKYLPIVTLTPNKEIRYCDKCKIIKPDRAYHCIACGKCILKMDHHCPWINNCVSFSNYKYFMLFLAYGIIMCAFVASTTLIYVLKFWSVSSDPDVQVHTYRKHIIVLFFLAWLLSASLFSLFTYHIYLISINRTTSETIYRPIFTENYNTNGFNLGCLKNIQEVFGQEKKFWPFPINTNPGNGINFPSTCSQLSV